MFSTNTDFHFYERIIISPLPLKSWYKKITHSSTIQQRFSLPYPDGWLWPHQTFQVTPLRNEFTYGTQHSNGIESFESYAKHLLLQFNGIPKYTFYQHLKETDS